MLIPNVGIVKKNINLHQNGFYAVRSFQKSDVIISFTAKEVLHSPNYLTVQISETEHIILSPTEVENINHSCQPNAFFNTTTFELEAIADIAIDEEITFFYPSAEWKMDQAFICKCGAANCLETIQGASFLTPEQIDKYRFTDFILKKLSEKQIAKSA
jgi:hypothetical protein